MYSVCALLRNVVRSNYGCIKSFLHLPYCFFVLFLLTSLLLFSSSLRQLIFHFPHLPAAAPLNPQADHGYWSGPDYKYTLSNLQ
ncbi:hypothetical protein P5673_024390, partial [Acropora cervicornis]